jgi:hypothetical protein
VQTLIVLIRVFDLLQIAHAKHLDVVLKQAAVRDRAVDTFESDAIVRQIEFEEVVFLIRISRGSEVWTPDAVEAVADPISRLIIGREEIVQRSEFFVYSRKWLFWVLNVVSWLEYEIRIQRHSDSPTRLHPYVVLISRGGSAAASEG